MGLHIGKYAFNSEEQAKNKIKALGEYIDEEGNQHSTHLHSVAELGLEVLSENIYSEGWELLHPAVYGTDYLVDVLWRDLEENEDGSVNHPYGWATYSVNVSGEGSTQLFRIKISRIKNNK